MSAGNGKTIILTWTQHQVHAQNSDSLHINYGFWGLLLFATFSWKHQADLLSLSLLASSTELTCLPIIDDRSMWRIFRHEHNKQANVQNSYSLHINYCFLGLPLFATSFVEATISSLIFISFSYFYWTNLSANNWWQACGGYVDMNTQHMQNSYLLHINYFFFRAAIVRYIFRGSDNQHFYLYLFQLLLLN